MRNNPKKTLKIAGFSIFFIFIIVYAFFGSYNLVFGIKIKNLNLEDGITTKESIKNITGVAKNAVNLSLNGREISIDQEGNFNDTIALLPGYNIITIRAEDKFGYVDEKNYKLIYVAENTF